MDANMMKFAMEQMRKMNPEQLQEMMRNMPSDAMGQAVAQMKDMKPEDWERAKEQMSSMDPETMSRQAAQANAQMAGRTQYNINASNQLKADGNQLHGRGAYREAAEKYERAKSNVEHFTSKEARDLARACTLNLSSCYLNLNQYDKCIEQCNQVLSGEADSLKALYRRGQAYLGAGDCVSAAADLERALRLTLESDASQAQPIRDKLQEAKDQIGALRAAGKLPPGGAAAPKQVAPAAGGGSSSSSGGGRSGFDADTLAKASEMMRANPDMLKQAQETMRGMSDEQLRGMASQMGVNVAPAEVRNGLENVDPEVMAKLVELQSELPADMRSPGAARDPENLKRLAELMAQKPEMAATMGQMLSSMNEEKLQEMARHAGLPPGVTITPELAKAAAESFKKMSPEEVQEAIKTVSKMQPPPAAAAAAPSAAAGREASAAAASTSGRDAAAAASPVAGMPPVDPRVAADMLAAMSPEQLASMSKMVPGMDKVQLTPEMLKMAAEAMKGMTSEDMSRMQEMAAAMGVGGGAAAAASGSAAPAASSRAAVAAAPGGMSPNMMSMASEMMKNMGPDDIARMQEMAAGMGMGGGAAASMAAAAAPGGMSPNMMSMASEMMKNMGPDDIARMQEMAAAMGMGGAAGAAGGLPAGLGAGGSPDAAMASMFSDPKMIESAVRMMKSMDPEAMASMMVSSGMCRDRAQAEAMSRQMSSLTDTQLRMMVKTASAVQSARAAGGRVLAWARANMWLVLALIVLVVALLLRWLGYM